MIRINISPNTNHHVSDNHLNHRGGCRCDFDKSEPLLMAFALDDTSLPRLAAPAEQLRRPAPGLPGNGPHIPPPLHPLLDQSQLGLSCPTPACPRGPTFQ